MASQHFIRCRVPKFINIGGNRIAFRIDEYSSEKFKFTFLYYVVLVESEDGKIRVFSSTDEDLTDLNLVNKTIEYSYTYILGNSPELTDGFSFFEYKGYSFKTKPGISDRFFFSKDSDEQMLEYKYDETNYYDIFIRKYSSRPYIYSACFINLSYNLYTYYSTREPIVAKIELETVYSLNFDSIRVNEDFMWFDVFGEGYTIREKLKDSLYYRYFNLNNKDNSRRVGLKCIISDNYVIYNPTPDSKNNYNTSLGSVTSNVNPGQRLYLSCAVIEPLLDFVGAGTNFDEFSTALWKTANPKLVYTNNTKTQLSVTIENWGYYESKYGSTNFNNITLFIRYLLPNSLENVIYFDLSDPKVPQNKFQFNTSPWKVFSNKNTSSNEIFRIEKDLQKKLTYDVYHTLESSENFLAELNKKLTSLTLDSVYLNGSTLITKDSEGNALDPKKTYKLNNGKLEKIDLGLLFIHVGDNLYEPVLKESEVGFANRSNVTTWSYEGAMDRNQLDGVVVMNNVPVITNLKLLELLTPSS